MVAFWCRSDVTVACFFKFAILDEVSVRLYQDVCSGFCFNAIHIYQEQLLIPDQIRQQQPLAIDG